MEHTAVTAMNSPVPEAFVQASQLAVEMWQELIELEIELEAQERAVDSGKLLNSRADPRRQRALSAIPDM